MFDLYAEIAAQRACPREGVRPDGLASGFVDECTHWFWWNEWQRAQQEAQAKETADQQRKRELKKQGKHFATEKEKARRCYIQRAQAKRLQLPDDLLPLLIPKVSEPLQASWLGLEVSFELETPWYSKDERPFHVLDNPVRKDCVFGVPYMSATSWKGMLRWAFRIVTGLSGPNPEKDQVEIKVARDQEVHLFGNEKGEAKEFHQGALVFYPTWFDKIGFEVINPHSRARRAGTQPIYYEVVPGRKPKPNNAGEYEDGGKERLYLLYAPWPGMKDPPGLDRKEAIERLLKAIEQLLTVYGISAKRTVGWGTAKITEWKASRKGKSSVSESGRSNLWNQIGPWFDSGGTP